MHLDHSQLKINLNDKLKNLGIEYSTIHTSETADLSRTTAIDDLS